MEQVKFGALLAALALAADVSARAAPAASACGKACLEHIGDEYRTAYLKHDPSLAPFAKAVRFTENNVELKFPDGSWDTVTQEVAAALTFSDPKTGGVGVYTAVMQNDTPAFLAIRLRVANGKIVEIEHTLSTKRWVSGPPTPFGDVEKLVHDPDMARVLAPVERRPRAEMIRLADGYFSTLSGNDGAIRTKFAANCHRVENGMETAADGCEKAFRLGVYRFNARVRDRDYVVVDEARGLVMARAYIDHKGALDHYKLTDGTDRRSPFREPHTWSLMETFKIENGAVGPIETDFIGSPYFTRSPWTKSPDCPCSPWLRRGGGQ
jgi:hypothetical protein